MRLKKDLWLGQARSAIDLCNVGSGSVGSGLGEGTPRFEVE